MWDLLLMMAKSPKTTSCDAAATAPTRKSSKPYSNLGTLVEPALHNWQRRYPSRNTSGGDTLLATSATMKPEHRDLIHGNGRTFLQDQRGPLDHLRPAPLLKGAIRVTVQQGATIFTHYMSDQLKEDMARDEKVQRGELSATKAEEEAEEWNEREWAKRWEGFANKLLTAYVKYHAVTAVMRLYEYLASRRVTVEKLNQLTLDPFAEAKRRHERGESATTTQVARECWHANVIVYLADYSVHQILLAFGYYIYVRDRQRKLQSVSHNTNNDKTTNGNGNRNDELHPGSLALSFLKKSTISALSRLVWLSCASLGGAVGSLVLPGGGWGILMGINVGDGVGISVTEELFADAASSPTSHP